MINLPQIKRPKVSSDVALALRYALAAAAWVAWTILVATLM
jgi:hypothetical protein